MSSPLIDWTQVHWGVPPVCTDCRNYPLVRDGVKVKATGTR